MSRQYLEKILSLVKNPSHYLGSEINTVRKNPSEARLRIALAFPDLYEVGMSHVGIQILYHILNSRDDIFAERVFAPGVDFEAELRAGNKPITSLETRTPLSNFDIIGFSLLYELNFTNILTILSLSKLPFYASERDSSAPFVIAGGPCTFNPEPLADFFDAMVVGDGEAVFLEMADTWLAWKKSGDERPGLLEKWSQIEGVYVPSLYEAQHNSNGLQELKPLNPDQSVVRKALVSDLNKVPYPENPVIAFGKIIHDRLSLEVCRGCTRGCRFCQAGMIYRPVRERAPRRILSLADRALVNTGYDDISLLSLSTGDYGALEGLMEALMNRCEPERIAVSLPSLRVGSLTESLISQVKRVRKTGFTIAPEAGSQRLRDVINKNVTEAALEENIRNSFQLGWSLVKLYFMIGLPTETDSDIKAIVDLVRRLQKIRVPGGGRKGINVSVSTFIPKSHTPFQWCSQISLAESKEKLDFLRSSLKGGGLRFKWQSPEMSYLEGIWARGDRRLSSLLVKAFELGCRFDGWTDKFHFRLWQEAIEATGVDVDSYNGARDLSDPLPWDHVDPGVSKEFLAQEYKMSLTGSHTPDCRHGECNGCGVCDFESVKPVTFGKEVLDGVCRNTGKLEAKPVFNKLQMTYSKHGPARFFGHLELVKIMMRAFRRARVPLRFSEGFHPAPKVSFESALPVGMESVEEWFFAEVPVDVQQEQILKRVNEELPEGIAITGCKVVTKRSMKQPPKVFDYTVILHEGSFSEKKCDEFLKSSKCPVKKTNKKGKVKVVDLRKIVTRLRLVSPQAVFMTLDLSGGQYARPTDVLVHVFGLSERSQKLSMIIKKPSDSVL